VNLASRLCAKAAGGQILVSESTYGSLGDGLLARKLDPILVKGKEAPVEVYEIAWDEASAGADQTQASA
jgi:adenylate cyclase